MCSIFENFLMLCQPMRELSNKEKKLLQKPWLTSGLLKSISKKRALFKQFKNEKIKFLRAKVGDRYVKEQMQKNKFNLGGEQSGHIILGKFATTGDGVLVALEIIKSMNRKTKASDFFNVFKKIPQILENIKGLSTSYSHDVDYLIELFKILVLKIDGMTEEKQDQLAKYFVQNINQKETK